MQRQANPVEDAGKVINSMLQAAAAYLGVGFTSTSGAEERDAQVKFEADELEMGLPPDAGRGIGPFLNFAGGEQALYSQVGEGLPAIIDEIEREGAEVDRECRDYILHEEYGSSKRKFQNGWMRDCRADRLHA